VDDPRAVDHERPVTVQQLTVEGGKEDDGGRVRRQHPQDAVSAEPHAVRLTTGQAPGRRRLANAGWHRHITDSLIDHNRPRLAAAASGGAGSTTCRRRRRRRRRARRRERHQLDDRVQRGQRGRRTGGVGTRGRHLQHGGRQHPRRSRASPSRATPSRPPPRRSAAPLRPTSTDREHRRDLQLRFDRRQQRGQRSRANCAGHVPRQLTIRSKAARRLPVLTRADPQLATELTTRAATRTSSRSPPPASEGPWPRPAPY